MSPENPKARLVKVPLVNTVKWRIGLVVLASDPTIEHSFQRMLAGTSEVALHTNRIAFDGDISVGSLRSMETRIEAAAAEIMPGQHLDAILYGCTSASAAIGDDKVRALLARGKPSAAGSAHTPVSAAMAAFQALNTRRISVIAPYPTVVTEMLADYLRSQGADIAALTCLGLPIDADNGRVSVDQIVSLAQAVDHADADTIFLSCTALRGAEAAERVEQVTGKHVVTSNQALLWRGLRQAGCDLRIRGFGKLMRI